MPALTTIDASLPFVNSAPPLTLTAADTIPFNPAKTQVLLMFNGTGATITPVIDGDAGTSVAVPGIGNVTVSGGLSIPIAANAGVFVRLSSISEYCRGTVNITAGASLRAWLLEM
jgi:hypothetical protein